jgi:hypothetical protein
MTMNPALLEALARERCLEIERTVNKARAVARCPQCQGSAEPLVALFGAILCRTGALLTEAGRRLDPLLGPSDVARTR